MVNHALDKKYFLGYGIGLRRRHFADVLAGIELPDWFEIVPENYMSYGGRPRKTLDFIKSKDIPIISHGVGLSLGSIDPLDENYLKELKQLFDRVSPMWFSDHLSFSSSFEHNYHDLLPILRTEETLKQMIYKIKQIEALFDIPFAIENASYYADSEKCTISEVQFMNRIIKETNSYLMLDINNVYVNSKNHGFNPLKFIKELDLKRVIQVHLAGHWDRGDFIIDTHGDYVCDEVWDLYEQFLKLRGCPVSTLIEWDNDLPSYKIVLEEAEKARSIGNKVFGDGHEK